MPQKRERAGQTRQLEGSSGSQARSEELSPVKVLIQASLWLSSFEISCSSSPTAILLGTVGIYRQTCTGLSEIRP